MNHINIDEISLDDSKLSSGYLNKKIKNTKSIQRVPISIQKGNRFVKVCNKNNIDVNISACDKLNTKEKLLMMSLQRFYKIHDNIDRFFQIINGDTVLSLRLIDWFVTNYSKKKNIQFNIMKNGIPHVFIVYLDYKSQLKAYSKKQFDPFCRRTRIVIQNYKGENIETTVGQLNFFKWAITNNILEYIQENLKEIDYDMNKTTKNLYTKAKAKAKTKTKLKKESMIHNSNQSLLTCVNNGIDDIDKNNKNKIQIKNQKTKNHTQTQNKKIKKKRRTRKELSISATKKVSKRYVKFVVNFD